MGGAVAMDKFEEPNRTLYSDVLKSQRNMLKEQSKMLNDKKTTLNDIILSISNQNLETMKYVGNIMEHIANVAKAAKLIYDRQNEIDSKLWLYNKRLTKIEDMLGIK